VNIDTQLKRKSTVVTSAQNSKITDNKETKIGLEINQHIKNPNQQQIIFNYSVFQKKQQPMFEKATPASDSELRALVYSYSWVQMIRGGDLKGGTCVRSLKNEFVQPLPKVTCRAQPGPTRCPKRPKSLVTVTVCRCVTIDIVV